MGGRTSQPISVPPSRLLCSLAVEGVLARVLKVALFSGSPFPAPGRNGTLPRGPRGGHLACFQGLEAYLRGQELQSPLILDENWVQALRP